MAIVEQTENGVLIRVKAVPGAKREQIAGALGDRLKVKVSAPPEGGKANKAICAIIAKALGVKAGDVHVASGATNPEKAVGVSGVTVDAATEALGLD